MNDTLLLFKAAVTRTGVLFTFGVLFTLHQPNTERSRTALENTHMRVYVRCDA